MSFGERFLKKFYAPTPRSSAGARGEVGEMVDLPFPGGEPLPQGYEPPEAVGYVCAVDREARTVTVSSERVEEAVADLDVPFWIYHFAVELGAQQPVQDIRPEPAMLMGRRWGKTELHRKQLELVAGSFFASKPPDR